MPIATSERMHSTAKIEEPLHSIELPYQIRRVECSPYEWSHNVICIAFDGKVAIGVTKFQEEEETLDVKFDLELLQDFIVESRVECMALSPEISVSTLPKSIIFACATADFKIRLFSSNLVDPHSEQVYEEHTSYINSIAYESCGDNLASTGDDLSVRIWSTNEHQCHTVLFLQSPGMSVCWHAEEPGKLLVAEKRGTITVFNVERKQAILSFDADCGPLTAADWSTCNSLRVAALVDGHLLVWDTTRASQPLMKRAVHPGGGRFLRYSQLNENIIATVGQPNHTLSITHANLKFPISSTLLKLASNITWHRRLFYVCVGVDNILGFWKVTSK
nr:PREDICTED: nucleoporin Nup37 [Bemisia tabaci]